MAYWYTGCAFFQIPQSYLHIYLFSPSPLPIIILFSIMESTFNKRHYHTWESTEVRNKVYFGWLLIRLQTTFAQLTTTTDVAIDYYHILFFVKSVKQPSNHFNILNYVTFSKNRTRSATNNKLLYNYSSNNKIRNSYFNYLPRLWNSLPPINTDLHLNSIKTLICEFLWNHYTEHFNSNNSYSYHFVCPCYNCCNINIAHTPNFN